MKQLINVQAGLLAVIIMFSGSAPLHASKIKTRKTQNPQTGASLGKGGRPTSRARLMLPWNERKRRGNENQLMLHGGESRYEIW